jgi:hypothetical protein
MTGAEFDIPLARYPCVRSPIRHAGMAGVQQAAANERLPAARLLDSLPHHATVRSQIRTPEPPSRIGEGPAIAVAARWRR